MILTEYTLIEEMISRAYNSTDPLDCLSYSQAALNAAKVLEIKDSLPRSYPGELSPEEEDWL